jgi:hypothetical protein
LQQNSLLLYMTKHLPTHLFIVDAYVFLQGAVKHAAAEAEEAVEEAGHKAGQALSAVKHKTVDPVGHAASSAAHSVSHAAGSAKDAIVGKGEAGVLLFCCMLWFWLACVHIYCCFTKPCLPLARFHTAWSTWCL